MVVNASFEATFSEIDTKFIQTFLYTKIIQTFFYTRFIQTFIYFFLRKWTRLAEISPENALHVWITQKSRPNRCLEVPLIFSWQKCKKIKKMVYCKKKYIYIIHVTKLRFFPSWVKFNPGFWKGYHRVPRFWTKLGSLQPVSDAASMWTCPRRSAWWGGAMSAGLRGSAGPPTAGSAGGWWRSVCTWGSRIRLRVHDWAEDREWLKC